jgi:glycopeptide antibiotics resistance protein
MMKLMRSYVTFVRMCSHTLTNTNGSLVAAVALTVYSSVEPRCWVPWALTLSAEHHILFR